MLAFFVLLTFAMVGCGGGENPGMPDMMMINPDAGMVDADMGTVEEDAGTDSEVQGDMGTEDSDVTEDAGMMEADAGQVQHLYLVWIPDTIPFVFGNHQTNLSEAQAKCEEYNGTFLNRNAYPTEVSFGMLYPGSQVACSVFNDSIDSCDDFLAAAEDYCEEWIADYPNLAACLASTDHTYGLCNSKPECVDEQAWREEYPSLRRQAMMYHYIDNQNAIRVVNTPGTIQAEINVVCEIPESEIPANILNNQEYPRVLLTNEGVL